MTGTFDNWSKSTKLSQSSDGKFRATVSFPQREKVLFKYVVDGQWTTTSQFKVERDSTTGIENNVVYPEQLVDPSDVEDYTLLGHNNSHSEAETTSFTNVSYGEMSPFEQFDTDCALDYDVDDDYDVDNRDNTDLNSSAQVTLSGGLNSVTPSSTPVNLVSVADGDRQVRYYTSMSLLSKFTKYFK